MEKIKWKMLCAFLVATILVAFAGCVYTVDKNPVSSAPPIAESKTTTIDLGGGSSLKLVSSDGNKSGSFTLTTPSSSSAIRAADLVLTGTFSVSGTSMNLNFNESGYTATVTLASANLVSITISTLIVKKGDAEIVKYVPSTPPETPEEEEFTLTTGNDSKFTLKSSDGYDSGSFTITVVEADKNLKGKGKPPIDKLNFTGTFTISNENLTLVFADNDYTNSMASDYHSTVNETDYFINVYILKGTDGENGYTKLGFIYPKDSDGNYIHFKN